MFALKTESIKGRMKQKGAFRKETHVDSHAHRGVTVVTLAHRTRHRSRGGCARSRTARISAQTPSATWFDQDKMKV